MLTSGRRAKTATQVLTRRVKQGVADWYVLEILEKSSGGFEMHTEAGFNIGMPCYGYQALRVSHPVPAKRAKGVKKTRRRLIGTLVAMPRPGSRCAAASSPGSRWRSTGRAAGS